MANWKVTTTYYFSKCERCKHSWKRRSEAIPKVCPKCKSPYWNKARRKKAV